ncbi:MAG: spore germination protein [Clostridia bacterium]|nr:spore germination protein [Clostridia bacterium]
MNLFSSLQKNTEKIKEFLTSSDVAFTSVKVGKAKGLLIFIKDVVDKNTIGDLVLRPAEKFKGKPTKSNLLTIFLSPELKTVSDFDTALEEVLSGNAVLMVNGIDIAVSFEVKKFNDRAVTEPPTSVAIKGPREGFVESITVNVSLIRRRIKSTALQFEQLSVGKHSKTTVALCYMKGFADKKLVNKLKRRIEAIDIDAIIDSSYVSKFVSEHKKSLFKQIGNTEKPDVLVSRIIEGRVAIIVDGSPIVLTVPYLLIEDFQSPGDYYASPYSATTARIIRILSVTLSVLLPAVFVAAELFHLQLIPLSFLLTIVNSIQGIPLSPSYEMFFTLMIFEILNEASVRMPKYVGMVVSIVGGLVLGETAVNAGIISPPALMIIALSGICLYTVPELEQIFSFLRFLMLIIAGSLGGYGIIVAFAILLTYLVSFESYGAPLLAPFSPLVKNDLKDGFYRSFLKETSSLPFSLNKRRANKRTAKENFI